MHVALSLLTLFPGRVGGSESNVRGILGEFAAGHGPERVTVLANRHVMAPYAGYARGPVTLRHVTAYRPGDRPLTRFAAMNAGRVWPVLDGRGFDVVHYPVTVPVPRVRDTPRVVSLLDVQHHELPAMFSALERRLRGWAYDAAARDADLVLTISEHARRGIIEHVGVAPDRVLSIPLGVDHARFSPQGPRAPEHLRLPERYVLYPANLWPHKNHARLLEAFAAVGDPDLWLILTGQTYGREAMLAGRERVRHLGHVGHDVLADLYRGAAAVVFPSLFEGFGLPPLEAMACGVPVAASDRGAIGEVCGEAALRFDPDDAEAIADAIRRVTNDAALRARLRTAGPLRAAGFTWEATARRHREAYALVA
ncbi:MAG: glycosyltransferase family 1 protein [Solirubrobacteraceae bacterium]|nr:glycosyltransferase family 1 protein [Solirubrobacteraceae bacterium]